MKPTQSLVYAKRGDRPLRLHLFSPQQTGLKHPVILWIHGGGWREGSPLPIPNIFSMFLKMGIAVAALEHRLTSQSADFPGQLVRWPAPWLDLASALNWIQFNANDLHLDHEKVCTFGVSSGGHLSALAAVRGHVHAAVDLYGPTDFLQMDAEAVALGPHAFLHDPAGSPESELVFGNSTGSLAELRLHGMDDQEPWPTLRGRLASTNPLLQIQDSPAPLFVGHSEKDPLVPYHQSELLVEALIERGAEVRFEKETGGEHRVSSKCWNMACQFLVEKCRL
ncbi:MAG: alpha/beta hydrolase [Planctomycetes bacterium]|nr:alpha/beta hydrolase [Planctomycetota bacterium]